MRVEVIKTWEGAAEIRSAWLDLMEQCGRPAPFVHPSFCELWMKHRETASRPFIIVLRDRAGIVGLAPLQIAETGGIFRLRRARFAVARPWLEVDFLVPGGTAEVFRTVLEAIRDESGVPVAEFFALNGSSPSLRLLESAAQDSGMSIEYSYSPQWRNALVEIRGGWDSYYQKRGPKLRKNARRASEKLRKTGELLTKRYRKLDPAGSAWAAVRRVSERSWKRQQLFTGERFWEDLLALLGHEGWLDLHVLNLDEQPIAFALLLRYGKTAYLLQTSYDCEYGTFSPGLLVILESLKALFGETHPPSRVDFLTAHPYLVRLSTGVGQRVKARVFMGGPRSMLVEGVFRARRQLGSGREERFFRSSTDLAMHLEKVGQVYAPRSG